MTLSSIGEGRPTTKLKSLRLAQEAVIVLEPPKATRVRKKNQPKFLASYRDGATVVFDDPSGAACVPGGVSP